MDDKKPHLLCVNSLLTLNGGQGGDDTKATVTKIGFREINIASPHTFGIVVSSRHH